MRPRRSKQYCLQLDIALWCKNQIEHSIWDESLLFCNCACSLEYSILSTLAGLSYHICGKLKVAFKASPSSQHQHCTDEAHKAETKTLSDVLFAFLQPVKMPSYQYPCSLVAQFTEDIYKNAGASDVLPLVMKSLDAEKVLGVQLLRAGRVRLTFDDPETCSTVLKDGLDLGDVTVQLFPADDRVRLVHLRDLPVEVDHDNVSTFFSAYGEVLSVDHCYFEEYPSVRNGNRIVKILLTQDIPCFVKVEGCNCRVWYPRQPAQCSICREFGHRAPACPLSGRCRRCHQPGHVARECTQAWGPSFSVSRATDYAMETEEVPVTTASVTSPVTSASIVVLLILLFLLLLLPLLRRVLRLLPLLLQFRPLFLLLLLRFLIPLPLLRSHLLQNPFYPLLFLRFLFRLQVLPLRLFLLRVLLLFVHLVYRPQLP